MRLGTLFMLLSIAVGTTGVLAATALVATSTLMRQQTEILADAVSSVRAMEELEVRLLMLDRATRTPLAAQGQTPQRDRRVSREEMSALVKDAQLHIRGDEEGNLFTQMERSVTRYLESLDVPSDPTELEGALGEAISWTEALIHHNLREAREAQLRARQIDSWSNASGVTLAVLLILSVGTALITIRRSVYLPLIRTVTALRDFGGGDREARVSTRGARELRELAGEYNKMATALRAAEARQLQFLAGIAHDLRNPLGALKLTAALLARGRDASADEALLRGLRRIDGAVDDLDRMVGDLLDRTRIEAGDLSLKLERCELQELARHVVELHQPVAEAHPITFETSGQPVWVQCDRLRIRQVLTNLLSNAVKYSPAAGPIRVEVGTRDSHGFVAVSDRGIGIAPGELERIFEPFHRSKGTAAEIPGVGLGLSVSRRIVHAHGGRIAVESTPGQGSTFRVLLPLDTPGKIDPPSS